VSYGEGDNLILKMGLDEANPPAYEGSECGKGWCINLGDPTCRRAASIKCTLKGRRGRRKSEGVVLPMKGRQQNFPEGRAPAST